MSGAMPTTPVVTGQESVFPTTMPGVGVYWPQTQSTRSLRHRGTLRPHHHPRKVHVSSSSTSGGGGGGGIAGFPAPHMEMGIPAGQPVLVNGINLRLPGDPSHGYMIQYLGGPNNGKAVPMQQPGAAAQQQQQQQQP
eukprot:PhM_4_TR4316/c0_g1_i1/m.61981